MKPRRPRILQVVQSLELGGVEQLQVTLARFHNASQIELHLCSYQALGDGPIARDLRTMGIPMSSLDGIRLHKPAAVLRLARLVRERQIDVLHAHLSTPNILATSAGVLTARPVVSTLHNLYSLEENRSRANRYLEMKALRRGTRLVIAVAPEIASDAQRCLGIHPRKLALVPNGIDISAFDEPDHERVRACRRNLLRGRTGPLVVSVGTLAPRKGHHLLVEATPYLLQHFPDAQVAIVGREAGNAAQVRRRIDSLGLQSHVACVGERHDVPQVLKAADLFALPSLIEGMPLALLEAMAARTPVVATKVGGIESVVADQVSGRLVAPNDADALGPAMVDTLASLERSRQLADAARARIEAEHGAELWVKRLAGLYAGVIRDG